ncbi:biological adhesion [Branchiostoma belcheri]|nr:biological adhesion [Branchiostoma belcheri]
MFSRLVRLLVLLLMESGSVSSWCADCAHAEYCRDKGLKRVPQDLPTSVDCLECGKNAIVSLTQSDFSRNLTVESGGRVTVEANFIIAIENITTTDSGLYVCLAASPVGSTSAKLSIYVHRPESVSSTSVHVHGSESVSSTSVHVHGPESVSSTSVHVHGPASRGLEDRRQITLLLAISLSGHLLPPQVLYQGKHDDCQTIPLGSRGLYRTAAALDSDGCINDTLKKDMTQSFTTSTLRSQQGLAALSDVDVYHPELPIFSQFTVTHTEEKKTLGKTCTTQTPTRRTLGVLAHHVSSVSCCQFKFHSSRIFDDAESFYRV